jgi:hypothetical protein
MSILLQKSDAFSNGAFFRPQTSVLCYFNLQEYLEDQEVVDEGLLKSYEQEDLNLVTVDATSMGRHQILEFNSIDEFIDANQDDFDLHQEDHFDLLNCRKSARMRRPSIRLRQSLDDNNDLQDYQKVIFSRRKFYAISTYCMGTGNFPGPGAFFVHFPP